MLGIPCSLKPPTRAQASRASAPCPRIPLGEIFEWMRQTPLRRDRLHYALVARNARKERGDGLHPTATRAADDVRRVVGDGTVRSFRAVMTEERSPSSEQLVGRSKTQIAANA